MGEQLWILEEYIRITKGKVVTSLRPKEEKKGEFAYLSWPFEGFNYYLFRMSETSDITPGDSIVH